MLRRDDWLRLSWLALFFCLPAYSNDSDAPDPALLEWLAEQNNGTNLFDPADYSVAAPDPEAMLDWLAWWQTQTNTSEDDDNGQK